MNRRRFLRLFGLGALASAMLGTYAVAIEPLYRLRITRRAFTPPRWTPGLRLRVAMLADLHACDPWMPRERVGRIVAATNALKPDIVLLLGDYVSSMRLTTRHTPPAEWAGLLAGLEAPLGTHAVLGNHDWWEDAAARARGHGPVEAGEALEAAGIPVLENRAVRLEKNGRGFWIAGLGDQLAFTGSSAYRRWRGVDDLPATLAQIDDEAPVLLMAHEPDVFVRVPDRVSLTLSGHTHGGQVRLLGWSPVVPSRYGNRYAYGHVIEEGRHLVVSGGLGCSIAPIRFGSPPEIAVLDLG